MSGPEIWACVRSGAAEESFREAFAPAGPLFGRVVGVESFRQLGMGTLGLVRRELFCGVPALPVDATQLKGAGIHHVLIFWSNWGEQPHAQMKHGD